MSASSGSPGSLRALAWALAGSAALHAALVTGLPEFGPEEPESTPAAPIEARLARLEPPAPAAPRPAPPPKARRAARPTPPPAAAPESVLAMAAPEAPAAIPEAVPEPALPPEPPAEAETAEAPPPAPETPAVQLPEEAELSFTLFRGADGIRVGRVTHRWLREGDRYTIRSVVEASGLFSLFYWGQLVQTSAGTVDARGLRPQIYTIQRGTAEKSESVTFEWEDRRAVMQNKGALNEAGLDEGAQDMLSLIHQIPFLAPEGGVYRLMVVTSRKASRYELKVVGEETLDTEMGRIRAVHLRQVGTGRNLDGTDLWLAPGFGYMPVKVQLTGRKGEVAEQVISAIKLR